MTIDEASRRLQLYLYYLEPDEDNNFYEAIQMGLEALKRCRVLAQEGKLWPSHPLQEEAPKTCENGEGHW